MTEPRHLPPDILSVTTGSSEPIYLQLVAQLRRLIAAGQIHGGDEMPSVREVASKLGVNPMTVSKAYSLLEAQGLLARRRGMGMVVAAQTAQADSHDARLELLRPGLLRIAAEARQLELPPAAVIALLRTLMKDHSP